MSHAALAKIDKLEQLYAEQRATLKKMREYVNAEFAKNFSLQSELNQQRRIVVRKCRLLDKGEVGRVKATMNSTIAGSLAQ